MAESLPVETPAVFHPTTPERVPAQLRALEGGVPQGLRVPGSTDPAPGGRAGQSPVVVQLAPTHVSGGLTPYQAGYLHDLEMRTNLTPEERREVFRRKFPWAIPG